MAQKIRVCKEFKFEAAHFLPESYQGECRNLHGHSYKVQITIEGDPSRLDQHGMLIDFNTLKEKCGRYLDEFLDHTFITGNVAHPVTESVIDSDQQVFLLPDNMTSTAENIALHLFSVFDKNLAFERWGRPLRLYSVRVYETATCFAEIIND